MSNEARKAVELYGSVGQCRREDGTLNAPHVIEASIKSVCLLTRGAAKDAPASARPTLKQFLVKRVFSNGGPITNREICAIADELFGERSPTYIGILEKEGCLALLGYTQDEMRSIEKALILLSYAESEQRGSTRPPETLFPYVEAVCVAVGFNFAKHNRE